VGIGRYVAMAWLALELALCCGCGLGPRNFAPMQPPPPLVRARAIGWEDRRPNSQVVPALLGRLEDPDPVVRLAAHEELRRRTGRDFGFVPWAGAEERSGAIARWWGWLRGRRAPAQSVERAVLPAHAEESGASSPRASAGVSAP
jgi:hypothetical protein